MIKPTNIYRMGIYVHRNIGFCIVDDFGNLVASNEQTQFASFTE